MGDCYVLRRAGLVSRVGCRCLVPSFVPSPPFSDVAYHSRFSAFLCFDQLWWFIDTTFGCAVTAVNPPMVVWVDATTVVFCARKNLDAKFRCTNLRETRIY
jgi:hypothetical protein